MLYDVTMIERRIGEIREEKICEVLIVSVE